MSALTLISFGIGFWAVTSRCVVTESRVHVCGACWVGRFILAIFMAMAVS